MLFNKYIVKITTLLFLLLSYLHRLPYVLTQGTITTQPVNNLLSGIDDLAHKTPHPIKK
jgi:hypothetical protein